MFGFNFIKFQPGVYALVYQNGAVVREGTGFSMFYYMPITSLVAIPVSSIDAAFIFEDVTADYQTISIQGQITFRIRDAKKISGLLNYTLDSRTQKYISDDPQKLSQRVINAVQVQTKKEIAKLSLRNALKAAEPLAQSVGAAIREDEVVMSLGLEILGVSVLAIKPNKETGRALEAEAREQILRESDDAVYARRNAALEQERKIKENELNTEIAVEIKRRQIRETKMDAERAVLEKQQQLEQSGLEFEVVQEERRKKLVELTAANAKAEADAKAYAISASMRAVQESKPELVQAILASGMQPNQLIAQAFQNLALRADKIGELNIAPDLLRDLMKNEPRNDAR
ncbi:MAG: SPFH domain-containing protein [Rhizobacter sp.]|nr:SPFH domain-containing protein [Chlorobiales bacterium]